MEFLKQRRAKNKRPCPAGQIYCLRCRESRVPAGFVVTYHALTLDRGNLMGVCPDCGARLYRHVSLAKLATATGNLQVTLPKALEHIDGWSQPSVNSDFRQDDLAHA